jgi:hypothetical protein
MTSWAKLTVAKLKQECDTRGIALTGLKLKQHYIDKLEEWEASHNGDEDAPDPVNEEPAAQVTESLHEPTNNNEIPEEAVNHDGVPSPDPAETQHANDSIALDLAQADVPMATSEPNEANGESTDANGVDRLVSPPAMETHDVRSQEEVTQIHAQDESPSSAMPTHSEGAVQQDVRDGLEASNPASEQIGAATAAPPTEPQQDLPASTAEDARKRKRRSASPALKAEEVALKKVKANDGSPLIRAQEKAKDEQKAIETAAIDADAGPLAHDLPASQQQVESKLSSPSPDPEPVQLQQRSASPEEEVPVTPARHAATCTLYIRNFKRPLRQPDLQAHIASLARGKRDDPSLEPIKFFYLDVIRTHAFVRLHSIAAASRVRSALHDTRWPNEANRDLLWVDFIPDDKAEVWANEEADASTGSGFGGRGGRQKRWEIIYRDSPDGVETSLQDANDAPRSFQQQQQRGSIGSARQPSISYDGDAAQVPGLHPDRAGLIPHDDGRLSSPRAYDEQPMEPPRKPVFADKSFAALEELFSSTEKSKPKLYYKPVAPEVVDERLAMLKNLRVGHNGMGRSGDEGMKRYTFERDRGREEWVDKGPEFGYGRKGRDRLTGDRGGHGGGGYRGRRGGGMPPMGPGGRGGYQDWDAPPPGMRGGDRWRGGM